jgi:hypothetical protein
MRHISIMIVATFVAGFLCPVAEASPPTENYWTSNGGGCRPIDTAIQGNLYAIGAGGVGHRASVAGTFVVLCPVRRNSSAAHQPNSISISVQDSDGLYFALADVDAKFYKMDLTNGATTLIGEVQSSYSGGACGGNGGTGDFRKCEYFTHTFDWQNNAYFVYVTIFRAHAEGDPNGADHALLYSVDLDYSP